MNHFINMAINETFLDHTAIQPTTTSNKIFKRSTKNEFYHKIHFKLIFLAAFNISSKIYVLQYSLPYAVSNMPQCGKYYIH